MEAAALIDTRAISKPRDFNGEDNDWVAWSFAFRSYCGLLSGQLEEFMTIAETQSDPIEKDGFGTEATKLAKDLYHLLVILCPKGRPVPILMGGEKHNGLEAWRLLCHEYEPRLPGRHASVLTGLIAPQWSRDLGAWRMEFQVWEQSVTRYETQSHQQLAGPLRIAIVQKFGPPEVGEAIRQMTRVIGDDYQRMRQVVMDYVLSGLQFSAQGVVTSSQRQQPHTQNNSMDINAVGKYGKGKDKNDKGGKNNKGKNDYFKGGGKWNDYSKGSGKWNDKGGKPDYNKAGKWNDKGGKPDYTKGGKGTTQFHGECSSCGVWGHKRVDCPRKVAACDASTIASSTASVAPSTYTVGAVTTTVPDAWIFAVKSGGCHNVKPGRIMLDSGAEENVSPPSFGDPARDAAPEFRLRDVMGRDIPNSATRHVDLKMPGGKMASTTFQVAPVSEPLMSIGRAVESGRYQFILDGDASIMKDKVTGEEIPVERVGRKFYLKVVAAVAAESASDEAMVEPDEQEPDVQEPDEPEHVEHVEQGAKETS